VWAVLTSTIVCCFLAPLSQEPNGTPPPNALVEFYRARARLDTAEIEWSRRQYNGPSFLSEHTYYYGTRLSPRERTLTSRGDEEGIATRTNAGTPAKTPRGFRLTFEGPDGMFEHWDAEADANWMPRGALTDTPDLRSLGAYPIFYYGDVHDAFWKDLGESAPPRKYAERIEGGLHVVAADVWDKTLTWWIDPQRGWQATRITYTKDGLVEKEARISLSNFGGNWFPQCVMYFSQDYKKGTEPCDVVTIDRAVFNDPGQPRVLTPADIGITPRMVVWLHDNVRAKVGLGAWDGSRITKTQFFPQAGFGATLVAQLLTRATPLPPAPQTSVRESEWEAYTRRFIERYSLKDDQAESALSVLRNCQERAQSYLARHKAEFEKLDRDEAKDGEDRGADAETRLRALRDSRDKLREPINDIFEKQLKPGLEKLPTRAQRAAAERDQPPATQSVQTP
jgi:hypothetical protein